MKLEGFFQEQPFGADGAPSGLDLRLRGVQEQIGTAACTEAGSVPESRLGIRKRVPQAVPVQRRTTVSSATSEYS